jgi:hypothetical protein
MSSRLAAVCLGIVLLGIAWARPHGPRPMAREATATLLAASWAQDGESRFSAVDLRRGYGLWEGGAVGVALLAQGESPYRYSHSWPFPAVASLLWRLVGEAAAPIFGVALWLLLIVTAWSFLAERWTAMLLLGGSALLPLAIHGDPVLLPVAAGGFATVWVVGASGARRAGGAGGALAAGIALAVAAFCEPLWALPAVGLLGVAVARLPRGQWTRLLAALVLAAALLGVGQQALLGGWWPPRDGEVRLTTESFPFEGSTGEEPPTTAAQRYRPASAPSVLREAGYLVAGRETGLLRLAPGALLVLLFSWRGWRQAGERRGVGLTCLVGFLAAAAIDLTRSPQPDRLALLAVMPSLLGLSPALPPPAWLAGAALTGLLTLPSLFGAPGLASRLPLELNRLDRLANRDLVARGDRLWSIPKSGAYPEERRRYGVWLAGGADVELVLVSPRPLEAVDLELSSPVAGHQAWVASNAERVRVRLDSAAKQAGTPIHLDLGSPSARNLDQFWPGGAEYYYRVRVRLDGGFVQHRLDGNRDLRSLGVFLALPE